MYGQESGAVILSQCTYPKGNGSAGVRTCSWTTNTCTVERVGPTLSGPRAEIDAPGVASDVAAQQSATEADKGAFAEACRTEGGQYEDLANGSFRCVTGGAETVVCDPTISLCHHVQLLSATETIKVVRPGDLPARKDVAATKPANRASGAGALAPAATPLAATPVPGSN